VDSVVGALEITGVLRLSCQIDEKLINPHFRS